MCRRTQPVGYHVHATDGDIGKIDEASDDAGSSRLVVDTGPWIFGRKVVLPAGTVQRVDDDEEKVYVDLTKDQIKNSPEWDRTPRVSMTTIAAVSTPTTATCTATWTGRPATAGRPPIVPPLARSRAGAAHRSAALR